MMMKKLNLQAILIGLDHILFLFQSLGFIDLEAIFGDEEDLDEERITEVAGGESNGMTS